MTPKEIVQAISDSLDADIAAYFGGLDQIHDGRLLNQCRKRRRRKNIILVLETYGGDPSAAYRIARCFQQAYRTRAATANERGAFWVLVFGLCKSAGTLLCVGADRILATDDADFGPIDVQLRKSDEVGERTSGLTPLQALDVLQIRSLGLFKAHFRQLRFDEDLTFSTKIAAEIATNLSVGLMRELYEQIDPIRLAEVERSLRIASEYGDRLKTKNVKEGGLARLLGQYPSHSFVIDKVEAREIFEEVVDPSPELERLVQLMRPVAEQYLWSDTPFSTYVSEEPPAPLAVVEPANVEAAQNPGAGGENPGGEQPEVQPAA